MVPHPLAILSIDETKRARDVVIKSHPNVTISFREIFLQEPAKADLKKFLELEHSGRLSPTTPRPPRLAKCQYDVIGSDRVPEYHESVVDVNRAARVKHEVIGKQHQAALTMYVKSAHQNKTSADIPTGRSLTPSSTSARPLPCSRKPLQS